MSDQIIFEFIVLRHDTSNNHLVIRMAFDRNNFPADNNELLSRIRAGVTKWARETKEGQQMYAYAGDDMNLTDLASFSDEDELVTRIEGCESFSITGIDTCHQLNFDTPLCEDLEL